MQAVGRIYNFVTQTGLGYAHALSNRVSQVFQTINLQNFAPSSLLSRSFRVLAQGSAFVISKCYSLFGRQAPTVTTPPSAAPALLPVAAAPAGAGSAGTTPPSSTASLLHSPPRGPLSAPPASQTYTASFRNSNVTYFQHTAAPARGGASSCYIESPILGDTTKSFREAVVALLISKGLLPAHTLESQVEFLMGSSNQYKMLTGPQITKADLDHIQNSTVKFSIKTVTAPSSFTPPAAIPRTAAPIPLAGAGAGSGSVSSGPGVSTGFIPLATMRPRPVAPIHAGGASAGAGSAAVRPTAATPIDRPSGLTASKPGDSWASSLARSWAGAKYQHPDERYIVSILDKLINGTISLDAQPLIALGSLNIDTSFREKEVKARADNKLDELDSIQLMRFNALFDAFTRTLRNLVTTERKTLVEREERRTMSAEEIRIPTYQIDSWLASIFASQFEIYQFSNVRVLLPQDPKYRDMSDGKEYPVLYHGSNLAHKLFAEKDSLKLPNFKATYTYLHGDGFYLADTITARQYAGFRGCDTALKVLIKLENDAYILVSKTQKEHKQAVLNFSYIIEAFFRQNCQHGQPYFEYCHNDLGVQDISVQLITNHFIRYICQSFRHQPTSAGEVGKLAPIQGALIQNFEGRADSIAFVSHVGSTSEAVRKDDILEIKGVVNIVFDGTIA
jgi:hypothetical protein